MSRSVDPRRPFSPVFIRTAALAALLTCASTCGGKSSPTAPDNAPVPHPKVSVDALTVTGESRSGAYAYRATVHLRETAGLAATILSVDLTFTRAGTVLASSHHEQPLADGTGVCAANGAIDTRELITLDPDRSHPYAATVQATVRYSDSTSFAATVTASAEVPPLPAAPALTLAGTVADLSTKTGIEGALVEVVNGANLGRTTTTDRKGAYEFRDLSDGNLRLRASASGYIAIERDIAVPSTEPADFELHQGCAYMLSPASMTVRATPASGTFSVAPRGGGNCAWTASTLDPWLSVTSYSDSVSFIAQGAESAQPRTGRISVGSPTGSATFTVIQQGAVCGPSHTEAVPAAGALVPDNIGDGCVSAARFSTDVPWLRYSGTQAGQQILFIAVDSNSGPERTGSVTFSGVGLYVRITYVQAAP